MKKGRNGFTLLEVLMAVVFSGVCATVLLGYIAQTQQLRSRIEATRQATLAAHNRCEQFSMGLIDSDIFSGAGTTPITRTLANPPDLPGGFPVREQVETITFELDSGGGIRSAVLRVEIRPECAILANPETGPRVVATGVRMR